MSTSPLSSQLTSVLCPGRHAPNLQQRQVSWKRTLWSWPAMADPEYKEHLGGWWRGRGGVLGRPHFIRAVICVLLPALGAQPPDADVVAEPRAIAAAPPAGAQTALCKRPRECRDFVQRAKTPDRDNHGSLPCNAGGTTYGFCICSMWLCRALVVTLASN